MESDYQSEIQSLWNQNETQNDTLKHQVTNYIKD
jgi:hypothetical protein